MIVLDDWQKEIIDYDGNILLASGRQIGKTQVFSIKCSMEMLNKPGTKIITVSLTEDQAKLIIIMVLDWLERSGHKNDIDRKGNNKPTQNRIVLKNGSWILARPVGTTGDALRGFTADILYMDEVARYSELIITAARPILMTTGGKIWMSSTFNAKKGFFWDMFIKNPNNRFKIWKKTSEEVVFNRPISESWSEKKKQEAINFLLSEKATMSNALYGQEYMAIPLDEQRRFFDEDWITKVCTGKKPQYRDPDWLCLMGNDIARFGGDQFTAEIGMLTPEGRLIQVESYGRRFLDTVDNEREIMKFDAQWALAKIGLDVGSGTLGVSVWDHLIRIPGMKSKLVAMNNRGISTQKDGKGIQRLNIEDYYDNLKSMGEKGEIELLDDENVKNSLRSIQLDIEEEKDHPGRITKITIWGADSHHAEGITRLARLARECKNLNFQIYYV